ncbi:pirin-like C-terminal cupin domain-containing protein [Archangium lansingense]|uniref:pirin-like C-terminal cupin domain-containing protein n=1 Tax=Archangium lansingense TaxID=2995310 RepID=UPI00358DA090
MSIPALLVPCPPAVEEFGRLPQAPGRGVRQFVRQYACTSPLTPSPGSSSTPRGTAYAPLRSRQFTWKARDVAPVGVSPFVLLAGCPLRERVVSYGPFVMNSEEQIASALERYRAGRMGRLAPASHSVH